MVSKSALQFRGTAQHDAQEFLLWLLDRVHEDLNHLVQPETRLPQKVDYHYQNPGRVQNRSYSLHDLMLSYRDLISSSRLSICTFNLYLYLFFVFYICTSDISYIVYNHEGYIPPRVS